MIAHRLSTIRNADQIHVFKKGGNIVERGTHKELMMLDGVYADLVRTQSLDSGDGDGDAAESKKKVPTAAVASSAESRRESFYSAAMSSMDPDRGTSLETITVLKDAVVSMEGEVQDESKWRVKKKKKSKKVKKENMIEDNFSWKRFWNLNPGHGYYYLVLLGAFGTVVGSLVRIKHAILGVIYIYFFFLVNLVGF
jgi:hypothetical protein